VEEANGIGNGVFDEHALSISGDEFYGGAGIVGEQNGGLVVPEVLDIELTKELALDVNLLLINSGGFKFAGRNIQRDLTPGGSGQLGDLLEHRRGSSSEGDEGNVHLIQSCQVGQRGQPRVEDQMGGQFPMGFSPEGDEAKDLLCFFPFSNIGVGIAEGSPIGIVGEKNQDAGLASASSRDVVALDHRVFPIVGDGMEIQVKGVAGQKAVPLELLVPEGKEAQGGLALDAAGVL